MRVDIIEGARVDIIEGAREGGRGVSSSSRTYLRGFKDKVRGVRVVQGSYEKGVRVDISVG